MRIVDIKNRIEDLEAASNAGAIPTTDRDGNRAWIRGVGCGIRFWRDILEASHDGDYPTFEELPEELAELVVMWSNAEIDGDHEHGSLARANRALARHILGLEHGNHL